MPSSQGGSTAVRLREPGANHSADDEDNRDIDDRDEEEFTVQKCDDPPTNESPPPSREAPLSPDDDPEDPRRVAHELVALAHAVLAIAGREEVLAVWCPEQIRQSVRDSAADVAQAVGRLHGDIASGRHDAGLLAAGIGGPVGKPKRKMFRRVVEALSRLVVPSGRAVHSAVEALSGRRVTQVRSGLKSAAGWGKLALDSISSEIPGGHVIKEALEVVAVGADTLEALETMTISDDTTNAG